jgi:Cdc6-like AAA superfamily ATPase
MLELTEQYIPDNFLFREQQINKIIDTFKSFKENGQGNNLILLGTTGAGKTSILKKIIRDNDNFVFVSVSEHKTTNKILKSLTKRNLHSDSDLQSSLIEDLRKSPKIIIIDEVGKISDMENFCNTLNAIYREIPVPIIMATNKWTFLQEMPSDSRTTLFLNPVELPCYSATQLEGILRERLELIKLKIDFNFNEGSLGYLCARTVKEQSSSVRTALTILNQCIIAMNDSQKFIDEKFDYLIDLDWQNFIFKLNEVEKEFLNVLLELSEQETEIPTPEISSLMKGDISPSKLSKLVTSFIDYGIIKAKWKHLGRGGGKHRIISFSKPSYRIKLLKLLTPWEEAGEIKLTT